MGTQIFMRFPTKLVGLHHVDQSRLELESFISHVECCSSPDVGSGWSREFIESYWPWLRTVASNSLAGLPLTKWLGISSS